MYFTRRQSADIKKSYTHFPEVKASLEAHVSANEYQNKNGHDFKLSRFCNAILKLSDRGTGRTCTLSSSEIFICIGKDKLQKSRTSDKMGVRFLDVS